MGGDLERAAAFADWVRVECVECGACVMCPPLRAPAGWRFDPEAGAWRCENCERGTD